MNGELVVIEDVSKNLMEYKIPFMLIFRKDISLLLSSDYDKDYVQKWSTELGLKMLLEEIRNG